ncbi:MAG: type II toxin-antitoxin system PemK/MazF family toxin [Acidobacteria bacterium]|nr:MAG: type II toxin-antitoxin system PemK/MazF family toxin [Acidobacteriota bacterium]
MAPRRGQIYFANLRAGPARKRRPVLIVSRDERNRWASDALVVPVSSRIRHAPTHVILDSGDGGLPQTSVALCEQVTCLDKGVLDPQPLGAPVSAARMLAIERCLLLSLGIEPHPDFPFAA